MKEIYNPRLQDFLAENGIYPEFETFNGVAHYLDTPKLRSLLDSYCIRYNCIPNKIRGKNK